MLNKKIYFIRLVLIFVLFISCQDNLEKVNLDFSVIDDSIGLKEESSNSLKIAIAAMTGPEETYKYYKDLNQYIENLLGKEVTIVQRKTYQEVNDLLANNKVDIAFICSGGYVKAKENNIAEILVVPVINDKVTYQSYLIVSKNSPYKKISDLKGKVFAFTDPLSNTGYLYPKWLINNLGYSTEEFFSKTFYTNSHDKAIQAVSSGIADGACIDGLIYEYLKKHGSYTVSKVKVIEKSQEFGIPPIVVPSNLNKQLKKDLKEILLNMNSDSVGVEILKHLGIDRFKVGNDSMYKSVKSIGSF